MKPIIQVKSSPGLYHVLAVLTVGVWGTTFISTKVLIENGMHPQDIFFLRFLIAYLGIWLISPKRIFAKSLRDEVLLLLSGLTGGTLYFLTENTALGLTQTTNVSFIICATPLLTTLLAQMSSQREKVGSSLVIGSLIALVGVGLLIFNGSFVLKLSPAGDLLTLSAVCSSGNSPAATVPRSSPGRSSFTGSSRFFLPFWCTPSAFRWKHLPDQPYG